MVHVVCGVVKCLCLHKNHVIRNETVIDDLKKSVSSELPYSLIACPCRDF